MREYKRIWSQSKYKSIKKNIMVRGLDNTKTKKKPWKNRIERDVMYSEDIKDAYLQMGKAYGEIVRKVVNIPKKKKK